MFGEKPVGIVLPRNKERTENKPIEDSVPEELLYFPVHGHIGREASIYVSVGDKVKVGDLLAKSSDTLTANVTSSVSGEVVEIKEIDTLKGKSHAVVVKNDFENSESLMEPLKDDADIYDLVDRILEAGIIGMSGTEFIQSINLNKLKKNANYIFLNGAECEGYSTTDSRVMIEYATELIEIAEYLRKIFNAKKSFITIEEANTQAIEVINKEISKSGYDNVVEFTLPNNYPQGDSRIQIRTVLVAEIPKNDRVSDAGVIFATVSTFKAIYDAVFLGCHLTDRVITVTGEKVKNPKNLKVKIGTLISHILKECDTALDDENIYVDGGPMMGATINNIDVPIEKSTNTILALPPLMMRKESACVRCSGCVVVCPVGIMPIKIASAYRRREYHRAIEYRSDACIDCGLCSFFCPANIDLAKEVNAFNNKVEDIRNGKN